MTISSLFIRRPRLAFVVSTVITIAGLLAITALPVAQFPDIVPPQVRVTATYPGASAQAVEEAVAQVIEAQVNGVENMIYMKSTSLLQVVAIYSPKGTRDGLFLSNFATITLLDTLKRVPGVGDATLFGQL